MAATSAVPSAAGPALSASRSAAARVDLPEAGGPAMPMMYRRSRLARSAGSAASTRATVALPVILGHVLLADETVRHDRPADCAAATAGSSHVAAANTEPGNDRNSVPVRSERALSVRSSCQRIGERECDQGADGVDSERRKAAPVNHGVHLRPLCAARRTPPLEARCSRADWRRGAVCGWSKAVWAEKRARPSTAESKHLKSSVSPGSMRGK